MLISRCQESTNAIFIIEIKDVERLWLDLFLFSVNSCYYLFCNDLCIYTHINTQGLILNFLKYLRYKNNNICISQELLWTICTFLASANRNLIIVRLFREALLKIALQSSINSTTMEWIGTTWHVITRNHGSARITNLFWNMFASPILIFVYNGKKN